jgi:hypothetical protein
MLKEMLELGPGKIIEPTNKRQALEPKGLVPINLLLYK